MTIINQIEWILPAYYASAIINNDYSGLSDEEEKALNDFFNNNITGILTLKDFDETPFFTWHNDFDTLGGDCLTFIELIYK